MADVVVAVEDEDGGVRDPAAQRERLTVAACDEFDPGGDGWADVDTDEHRTVTQPFGGADASASCDVPSERPEAAECVDRGVFAVRAFVFLNQCGFAGFMVHAGAALVRAAPWPSSARAQTGNRVTSGCIDLLDELRQVSGSRQLRYGAGSA